MQSDDDSLPEKSKHAGSRKLHLQRQNPQINAVNSHTLPKSAISAIKCRIADTTLMEKNKVAETTKLVKRKSTDIAFDVRNDRKTEEAV